MIKSGPLDLAGADPTAANKSQYRIGGERGDMNIYEICVIAMSDIGIALAKTLQYRIREKGAEGLTIAIGDAKWASDIIQTVGCGGESDGGRAIAISRRQRTREQSLYT